MSAACREIFGSLEHKFELHPVLTEEVISAFEATHRIILPPGYRNFLLKIGNGGAGPYYGVFKLGEMDDGHGYARWTEGNGFVGILSKPFPHSEQWNDLSGQPEREESFDSDEAIELAYDDWEKKYWNPDNVNGAIPICHLGCALRQWLVINGPEAGNIWCDDRVDLGGIHPLKDDQQERVDFMQWYCAWVDKCAKTCERP